MANAIEHALGRTPRDRQPVGRGGAFRRLRDRRDGASRAHELVQQHSDLVRDAVCAALYAGCGLLIAPTSDGGALSVTLYDGDERDRTYITNPEELEALAETLRDLASDRELAPTLGATPKGAHKPS